jgi:hypothetical protein
MNTDNQFEDKELQNAWIEWEQHRKEKKQKLTPLSVKKQLRFLQGRSKLEIISIIDQSIMNGWTGLFELKTNGQINKHQQHTASLASHFAQTYGEVLTGGKTRPSGGPDAHTD